MSVKYQAPIPICADKQLQEFAKFPFTVFYRDEKREAFLVRFKGTVYGYLNQCVHMPKALDCEDENIFDESGRYIRCSMHSICYDPVSGASVSELCAGKKLTALKIRAEGEWLYLADKRAAWLPDWRRDFLLYKLTQAKVFTRSTACCR